MSKGFSHRKLRWILLSKLDKSHFARLYFANPRYIYHAERRSDSGAEIN